MKKRKGFTLIELCIAMVLLSLVGSLAVKDIELTGVAFTDADRNLSVLRADAAFTSDLNTTIRETSTAFTIPERSFIPEKLTEGWNYLGLMKNVHVPAGASYDGKEYDGKNAVVSIVYAGDSRPASCPKNANLIENNGSWFIQTVLAYDYTDSLGKLHEYSLLFEPTDPVNKASQTIKYNFSVEVTEKDGNKYRGVCDINVDTMLQSLNAVQVVYQGSADNPAAAIAFRGDFLPTYSVESVNIVRPRATVLLVLDLSGSMEDPMESGAGTRIQALKTSACQFIEQLSDNNKINVFVVPFSCSACSEMNYTNSIVPGNLCFNANAQKDALKNAINNLVPIGGTNVGDGLRYSYYQLKQFADSGNDTGSVFIILMTDGAMNTWSITKGSRASDALSFYYGADRVPPYVSYIYDANRQYYTYLTPKSWFVRNNTYNDNYRKIDRTIFPNVESLYEKGARTYMKYWAEKFVNEYSATTFLLSLCNGMSAGDRNALTSAFQTSYLFDISSLSDFQKTFDIINANMNDIMWAFEGPEI